MRIVPLFIPMGSSRYNHSPLSKWEERYYGFAICCGLVGFAYGNLRMYNEIQENKRHYIKYGTRREISPAEHILAIAFYTSGGMLAGLLFPMTVPSIMVYYYANKK